MWPVTMYETTHDWMISITSRLWIDEHKTERDTERVSGRQLQRLASTE